MGLIVLEKKGMVAPEPFLKKVVPLNQGGCGVMFASDGEVQINNTLNGATVEGWQEAQEGLKVFNRVFILGTGSAPADPKDLQPYSLLFDATGHRKLSVVMEGNFPAYVLDKTHPPEFNLVKTWIKPRVDMLWRTTKQDLGAVLEELRSDEFWNELKGCVHERGQFTFLAGDGTVINRGVNPDEKSFDWGWTTKHYGYDEKSSKDVIIEPKKVKASMFGEEPPIRPVEQPDPAHTPGNPEAPISAPGGDTVIPVMPEMWVKPPSQLYDQKNPLINWFREWNGWCPTNWREMPAIKLEGEFKAKWIEKQKKGGKGGYAMKQLVQAGPDPNNLPQRTDPNAEGERFKNTDPVHLGLAPAPSIPIAVRTKYMEDFLKSKDVHGAIQRHSQDLLARADKLQEMESKRATLKDQLGITLDEFDGHPLDVIFETAKRFPEVVATAIADYRGALFEYKAKVAELEATLEVKTAPGTSTTKEQLKATGTDGGGNVNKKRAGMFD